MVSGQTKREVGGGEGGEEGVIQMCMGKSEGALLSAECTDGGMFF